MTQRVTRAASRLGRVLRSRSFTDVHCADQDWQPIETFYDQGITSGCGGGAFCADSAITRGQMMVFLVKTFGLQLYGP